MNLLQIDHVVVPAISTPLSSLISIQAGLQAIVLNAPTNVLYELGKAVNPAISQPVFRSEDPITAATAATYQFLSTSEGILTIKQYG
jgi:hypothetical protein